MTGKDKFNKFKLPLKILIKITMFFPRKFRAFLYDISMSIPTVLGVTFRYILVKSLINECGDNVYIARWVTIKNFGQIKIGNNVSIHEYSYLDGIGSITIGDNVSIAHNSSLISFEHSYDGIGFIKYQNLMLNPIIISQDVWIGCGCRILSGTLIENRVVIGANSVVKNKICSNSLYVGSPAKKIKDIL